MLTIAKLFLPILIFFPLISKSTEIEYKVKGMTCSACIKSIRKSVCESQKFEICKVEFARLILKTKDNQSISQQQIEKLLKEAGDFTIVDGNTTP